MNTECTIKQLAFHGLGRRKVVGGFNGGEISSDGGGLLLREVEVRTHILRRLSACFTDRRAPGRVEHELETLIKQRVFGLAVGYEDLVDHDALCGDRLLALLSWCEEAEVEYVLGLVKNARLKALIAEALQQAQAAYAATGAPARAFRECRYQTRKSWSRSRRVVGKAEYLSKGVNPRFIVTSLPVGE